MLTLAEKFVYPFTNATVVTILGTTHGLRSADLGVFVYSNASLRAQLTPGSITMNDVTFDVEVTFLQQQSGRVILLG